MSAAGGVHGLGLHKEDQRNMSGMKKEVAKKAGGV